MIIIEYINFTYFIFHSILKPKKEINRISVGKEVNIMKITGMKMTRKAVQKQERIYRCAQVYMKYHGISFLHPVRFDVLAMDNMEITWIQNAFGGM